MFQVFLNQLVIHIRHESTEIDFEIFFLPFQGEAMCIVPRIVRKTITPSQPIPIIVSKYQRSIIPTWQHEAKVKILNFKVLANLQIGQRSNSGRWHNLHITVLRKNIQKGINFEACLQSVHFSEGSNLHPLHGINSP